MGKKVKCVICNAKPGKRSCQIKDKALICPVCCAKTRNIEECDGCKYFEISEEFKNKKVEKATSKVGSIFGSPQLQKTIMEASIDLMNNNPVIGKEYDEDPEKFKADSYEFFNTDEFKDFFFEEEEILRIIKEMGEPKDEEGWFHTEEGTAYYAGAVKFSMSETRFRVFSQKLFKIFIRYYQSRKIKQSWILLSTVNRLMEGEFVIPFTNLMFFRGISKWKLGKSITN